MECHLPTGPPPRRSWGRPQGRLPAPVPLTSTARLHAQPWEAPRAPPASRPAPTRARPLGAAWRDPAPPPRRPPQGRPRPAEWAVQCGGGVPGASPPPGRGHAQAPHVTRVPRVAPGARGGGTAEFRIPPSHTDGCVSGSSIGLGLRGGSGSPSIPTEAPGLAAAGHCWSTKGLAPQRPPFPPPPARPRSSSRNLPPRHTLRLRSPEEEAEGQLPPTLPSCRGRCPSTRGRSLVRACPTPSGMEAAGLDLRRRRHLAA